MLDTPYVRARGARQFFDVSERDGGRADVLANGIYVRYVSALGQRVLYLDQYPVRFDGVGHNR